MQAVETVNQGLEREFTITVPYEEIDREVEKELKSLSAQVKIPGFRPGKIPMDVMKRKYADSVTQDVVNQMMKAFSKKVLDEKSMRPAMPPKAEIVTFEPGKVLEYKIKFDLFPEIGDVDFTKVELEEYNAVPTDKDIDNALERLTKANRKVDEVKEADYKAKKGDVVLIDFKGFKNGEPFQGGESKNYYLELGSGQFIPGFEPELEGMKAGEEKRFKIAFPADYGSKDLAGQETEFEVKVHKIMQINFPEVNDEFAKTLGVEEGLDALKKLVKEGIEKELKVIARLKLKRELFDHLEKTLSFEVPKSMLEIERTSIMQKLKDAKANGDPSLVGKSDQELETEYAKIAKRRVMLGLYLSEEGKKSNIKVTDDEMRSALIKQAQMYPGEEKKVFEFYKNNPDYLEDFRGPIFEDKVVNMIINKLKLKTKDVSVEELEKAYTGTEKDDNLPVSDGTFKVATDDHDGNECNDPTHNH